jgi:hypothetical protein
MRKRGRSITVARLRAQWQDFSQEAVLTLSLNALSCGCDLFFLSMSISLHFLNPLPER